MQRPSVPPRCRRAVAYRQSQSLIIEGWCRLSFFDVRSQELVRAVGLPSSRMTMTLNSGNGLSNTDMVG